MPVHWKMGHGQEQQPDANRWPFPWLQEASLDSEVTSIVFVWSAFVLKCLEMQCCLSIVWPLRSYIHLGWTSLAQHFKFSNTIISQRFLSTAIAISTAIAMTAMTAIATATTRITISTTASPYLLQPQVDRSGKVTCWIFKSENYWTWESHRMRWIHREV